MIVSDSAPELQFRMISIRGGITPPKLDRIDNFAPHVGDKSGSQCSFVALILRQVWIDVVGEQKPFSELSSVHRSTRRNDVGNVKRLFTLHASAEHGLHGLPARHRAGGVLSVIAAAPCSPGRLERRMRNRRIAKIVIAILFAVIWIDMPAGREWRPYLLRHSLATLVRNNGAKKWDLEGFMGHRDGSQTEVYAIGEFPTVVRALNRIIAKIEKLAPGSTHRNLTGTGAAEKSSGDRKM